MAVGWAVVRSLAGFPGAGPTGADYFGGVCLLLATCFVIYEFRYVDSVRSKYADTVPSLIMQIEGNSSSLRTPLRALFWTLVYPPRNRKIPSAAEKRGAWGELNFCG